MNALFSFEFDEPIVCTAIHHGHGMHPDVKANLGISEGDCLREEDPYTGLLTDICNNRIVVHTSRFETDLNRTRDRCFYRVPGDAWGLPVRREPPGEALLERAQANYDTFYHRAGLFFGEIARVHPKFFVYDIHSYCHQRGGPGAPYDDPELNPEVILGRSTMEREWYPLVERIQEQMRRFEFQGHPLDVRTDIKFTGGDFSEWLHATWPGRVCCIAIEFKKIFMDEWTGELNPFALANLKSALASTLPVIRQGLM